MKLYKIIDVWISALLISYFIIIGFVKHDDSFFMGYYVVGLWQLLSMSIHHINHWFVYKGNKRSIYHDIILALCLAILLGMLFVPLLGVLFYVLLFAAPFMAMYYTWLCYHEVYVKMQRPLSILK